MTGAPTAFDLGAGRRPRRPGRRGRASPASLISSSAASQPCGSIAVRKSPRDGFAQPGEIPLLLGTLARHELVDDAVDDFGADAGDGIRDVLRRHQLGALLVDHLALVVGDVIVFEQVLAQVEVVGLDLALGALDLAREHVALDHFAFLHAGRLQPALGALGVAEDPHQVVFERQVEAARARIALAARTAAQLVVDATRFVAFGADDVQATGGDDRLVAFFPVRFGGRPRRRIGRVELLQFGLEAAAEHDVGAAPGHVRCDRHRARAPGLRDDVASRSCCLALSTWCWMSCFFSRSDRNSEVSTEVVPTSAGCRASRTRGCPR